MENLFLHLQKLSNGFLGVNFFNKVPKTKIQVVKSIFYIILLIVLISLSVYNAFFVLNVKYQTKIQISCTILGASSFLMFFVSFWRNENQYQLLSNWTNARYAPRSLKLIDDISTVAYGALSKRIWKIVK